MRYQATILYYTIVYNVQHISVSTRLTWKFTLIEDRIIVTKNERPEDGTCAETWHPRQRTPCAGKCCADRNIINITYEI
jgi:hypothetical protein